MTELKNLIEGLDIQKVEGSTDIEIANIVQDSRLVEAGDLFVAIIGTQVDGHQFIDVAINRAAAAIVCSSLPDQLQPNVTYILVEDSQRALQHMLRNRYGNLDECMQLIGVTGTNGKTTVATLCYQVFTEVGFACGLFSTVEVRVKDEVYASTHTTPDVIQLYQRLHQMYEAGCTHVFMELSSHALHQNRTGDLNLVVGVFTNATRDHLDYHGDFKSYLDAKKLLFDNLGKDGFAILCAEDKHTSYMMQNSKAKKITYALSGEADERGKLISTDLMGTHLRIDHEDLFINLSGRYNALNAIAAYVCAKVLNIEKHEAMLALSKARGPEGRFVKLKGSTGKYGIVDYAHTADAMINVLESIRDLLDANQNMIVVFGAGGDRDKGKRPQMASAGVRLADQCVLTSDNPRSENIEDIINDMLEGLTPAQQQAVMVIPDRRQAIHVAVQLAKPDDVVVVLGKGHETYQEIKGEKLPFDDKKILQEYLNAG